MSTCFSLIVDRFASRFLSAGCYLLVSFPDPFGDPIFLVDPVLGVCLLTIVL